MRKYFLLFTGIFALIVFVVAVAIFVITRGRGTPTGTPLPPPEGAISIQGRVLCLPHKNTLGPQTLECAFGLQDSEGRYYGLTDSSNNYSTLASIPTNTDVTVVGTFTPQVNLKYPTVGVIAVNSIGEAASTGLGTVEGTAVLTSPCTASEVKTKDCSDKPFVGDLILTSPNQAKVVKEFATDFTGKFSVQVTPGQYVILSKSAVNQPPYCESPGMVSVSAGQKTKVDIVCKGS